tara:strand:+ start:6096 stop:7103 length:1008 start_codon:yes stop_codon:yes gene_type:complete
VSDIRRKGLEFWLSQQLGETCFMEPISGDASARRYFRFTFEKKTYIAVDAPPDTENSYLFSAVSKAYAEHQLIVPIVKAIDTDQGFMWLTDLGDQQLFDFIHEHDAQSYYEASMTCLHAVRHVQKTILGPLPEYDAAMLRAELDLMEEWFLLQLLKFDLTEDEVTMIKEVKTYLVDCAVQQPQVGVHRDFHARNIMWHEGQPAIIDFQGAVVGPVTYDLVSLLKDCYVCWDKDFIDTLLKNAYQELIQAGWVDQETNWSTFKLWFDMMGMQRHIKVLGIFSRLSLRDGKDTYLKDIPLTLKYVMQVADAYGELQSFSIWLHDKVEPAWEKVCIVQ